jgi:hypothetical protein
MFLSSTQAVQARVRGYSCTSSYLFIAINTSQSEQTQMGTHTARVLYSCSALYVLLVVKNADCLRHDSLTVVIPPRQRTCFYEDFEKNDKKVLDVFVQKGGKLDINVQVRFLPMLYVSTCIVLMWQSACACINVCMFLCSVRVAKGIGMAAKESQLATHTHTGVWPASTCRHQSWLTWQRNLRRVCRPLPRRH